MKGTVWNAVCPHTDELELHPLVVIVPVCGNFTTHCGGIYVWEAGGWVCNRRVYVHDSSCCLAASA